MTKEGSSVRVRVGLRDQLKLFARQLSKQRKERVTMMSLLEDGIDALFEQPLEEWIRWVREGQAPVGVGESVPFRISPDRAKRLGLLAAEIQNQSSIPVTIVQLVEEAGRRMSVLVEKEQVEIKEMEALFSE